MSKIKVGVAHASMQFSDSRVDHEHDAKAVFDFATDQEIWAITGTEAGQAAVNHDLRDLLHNQAVAHDFVGYFHKFGDWVALNKRFLHDFGMDYMGPYIPELKAGPKQGGHSPRGITVMSAQAKDHNLGQMSWASAHYLTSNSIGAGGHTNDRLIEGTGEYGRKYGGGKKICWFDADTNENDAIEDVFRGEPFTTVWDELGIHPGTHGPNKEKGYTIDVIATYDHDKRVTVSSAKSLDDGDIKLKTDHFLIVARCGVEEIGG